MSDQQSIDQLLQWSIENSANGAPTDQQRDPSRGLNAKALAELLGGPSDADRMREAMSAIVAPVEQVDMENKMVAWDNLEQLIENLDNANNMDNMGLWPPLLQQLESQEAESRHMACWCVGTAVQNNIKSQEKMKSQGGIAKLAKVATEDREQAVRKKAITALSSGVRNFQPGLDELESCLPQSVWTRKAGLDAGDMDAVDELIQKLRTFAASAGQ